MILSRFHLLLFISQGLPLNILSSVLLILFRPLELERHSQVFFYIFPFSISLDLGQLSRYKPRDDFEKLTSSSPTLCKSRWLAFPANFDIFLLSKLYTHRSKHNRTNKLSALCVEPDILLAHHRGSFTSESPLVILFSLMT